MRQGKTVMLIVVLSLIASAGAIIVGARAQGRNEPTGSYVPGEVWIKPLPGMSLAEAALLLEGPDTTVERGIPQLGWMRLKVPVGQERKYLSRMRAGPRVQDADLNHLAHILGAPNDSDWGLQWNMRIVRASDAWGVITSTVGVTVAVVDTGVAIDHPDLQANIWTNPGEIADNGIDDDGNGQVDDVHGWHFYTDPLYVQRGDNDVDDPHGHGTHVAGIIAAVTDNGAGVAGMSWTGPIMPVRVLDRYGSGEYSDIASGIVYAADNGARIINLSLGGTSPDAMMYDALHYARGKGCLIVAAAGNCGGNDSTSRDDCDYTYNPLFYPAAYPETVAVAATDALDQWAEFSEHHDYVDLAAPGTGIYSTWASGDYTYETGTSMAAPHVSGLAALVWALRPDLSNREVQRIMEGWAADVNGEGYPGKDEYLGWGRIDAYLAVLNASRGTTITLASSVPVLDVGPSHATITSTMSTEHGPPPDGTPMTFTTTLGYLSPLTATLRGGMITTTLTAGTVAGDALITARAEGVSQTLGIPIRPGGPANVAVACDPVWVPADRGTSAVTVIVADRYGNAVVDGSPVTVTTSLGSIFPPTGLTLQGEVRSLLAAHGVAGRAHVTAMASSAVGWADVLFYAYLLDLPIIEK